MFQRSSRRRNPGAKILTTVPTAVWHKGVVSSGNQVASLSIQILSLHAGFFRSGPWTSLANRGNNMKKNDLNKSMCEEVFGREFEVTVEPDYS